MKNEKLAAIKKREKLTFRAMGDMLGLHLQHVAAIVDGRVKPSRLTAAKLIDMWPELTYDDLMKD